MKRIISVLTSIVMVLSMLILNTTNVFASGSTYVKEEKNIVDIAIGDGKFTTLVEALKAADLVDTLKGEGPFTVFAPTDDAFKKLPSGTIENLLKPENKNTLQNILLYHVAKDNLTSKDILKLNGEKLTLANGKTVNISVKNGDVFINDSKVIVKDIKASNGIIHVIDTVLLPK
ncbi:fasciclin domain-containing protein [Clostridium botulinum]|nr:fasciclin domain-containing protein [Clostridium botulinum]MBN1051345.1 fasciclin domain-containing protein [Clostridium botulinum]